MPATNYCCPRCQSMKLKRIVGGFLERGPYDGSAYADEQDVEGYRCKVCGTAFCIGALDEKYDVASEEDGAADPDGCEQQVRGTDGKKPVAAKEPGRRRKA